MSEFSINQTAPGRLEARGAMSFCSAAHALPAGLSLIPRGERCTICLADVTEADSAGLAVLVEWLATARKRGSTIRYESIPVHILDVAKISDLDELLTNGH